MSELKFEYKLIKWYYGQTKEIPKSWDVSSLGNVVIRLENGFSYNHEKHEKTGIPITRIETISKEKINEKNVGYIQHISEENLKKYQLELEDILFSHINSLKHVGKTAVYDGIPEMLIHGMNLLRITPNKEKIIPKFLYYTLRTQLLRERFRMISNRAINQVSINTTQLKKIKLILPSIPEQKKIASILSRVDALIQCTQDVIEKTERLKKGLMQKLLVRGINHTKFKKVSWLFGKEIEIPEEWNIGTFNDLKINTASGGTPSRTNSAYYTGSTIWVKSGELKDHFINNSEEKITSQAIKNSSVKEFPEKTMLIAMYGATIGKTSILSKKGTTNQAICAIYPNDIFHEYFLQQFFIKNRNILVTFEMGAGQPNINQEIIRKFKYFIPHIDEQQKIASILSGVDAYIQKNQEYKEQLERLKKGLMQKLLTGQIRVKV